MSAGTVTASGTRYRIGGVVGPHVKLTAITEADLPVLYQWINAPDLVHYNSPFRPIHERDHLEWFERIRGDRTRVLFGIRPRRGTRLIGLIQLFDIDLVHRNAELSIRISDSRDRGKGLGSDAVSLVVEHAWRDLNLHRVWLRVFAGNARALAAYSRAGFREEGRMMEAAYINGIWVDVIVMGIVAGVASRGGGVS